MEQLRLFPEISADELIRYFTPTSADVAFVDPGKGGADLTFQLVGHLLTAEVRGDLERMLAVDAGLGMMWLEWLVTPARDASATSVKTAIDKLTWLHAIDAHQMDVSVLPNELSAGEDVTVTLGHGDGFASHLLEEFAHGVHPGSGRSRTAEGFGVLAGDLGDVGVELRAGQE
ncbi:hypothetical protein AB0L88_05710 [Saccharopolyspora shandongensis]|uniref:hypothetical protein n=1 Tax=Saccharopolyspora shandongensis TaxID=418495 RepID=UPI0034144DE1